MKHSTDRILTTHVGSLPRPPELADLLRQRQRGALADEPAFEALVARSVQEIVACQVAVGLGRESHAAEADAQLSGVKPSFPVQTKEPMSPLTLTLGQAAH